MCAKLYSWWSFIYTEISGEGFWMYILHPLFYTVERGCLKKKIIVALSVLLWQRNILTTLFQDFQYSPVLRTNPRICLQWAGEALIVVGRERDSSNFILTVTRGWMLARLLRKKTWIAFSWKQNAASGRQPDKKPTNIKLGWDKNQIASLSTSHNI